MNGIVTYRPSRHSLLQNWDRVIDSFFTDRWTNNAVATAPSVDVRDQDGSYLLEAELPGRSEKDVDVKVERYRLTISSSNEEKQEEKRDGYLMRERRSSSFTRSFVLPADVDREKIEANFKNGVLTLIIPKLASAKPRQIPVKTA